MAMNMWYLLILSVLTIAKTSVIKDENCEGVIINDIYHEKEKIKEELDRPYMFSLDQSTNTLYFSYSVNNSENDDIFKTARIELDSNEFYNIDVVNGFAQTIDEVNNAVYIGSNDGIYKYDHNTNAVDFFGQRGSDIWAIFYKDALYFSEFPSQFLYILVNDTVARFKDLEDTKVDHFIIDKEDTMFYTNTTGLFGQKRGNKNATLYKEFTNSGPRGITVDGSNDVYLCLREGIYKLDKINKELIKTVNVDDCFGIAFDKDNNMIYANWNSIVRLKPNSNKSC